MFRMQCSRVVVGGTAVYCPQRYSLDSGIYGDDQYQQCVLRCRRRLTDWVKTIAGSVLYVAAAPTTTPACVTSCLLSVAGGPVHPRPHWQDIGRQSRSKGRGEIHRIRDKKNDNPRTRIRTRTHPSFLFATIPDSSASSRRGRFRADKSSATYDNAHRAQSAAFRRKVFELLKNKRFGR